jgi:hypothetical protein
MSGHLGLREDARIGAQLAGQIARLFAGVRLSLRVEHLPCEGLLIGRAGVRPQVAKPSA